MPPQLHRNPVVPLRQVVALAHIVQRVELHHQVVHPGARSARDGQAVVPAIDVHEIQRHRRPHEVGDLESQQVAIEGQRPVDVGHHQHRMAQAMRPGPEAPDMA
jgi:hypothetical protein